MLDDNLLFELTPVYFHISQASDGTIKNWFYMISQGTYLAKFQFGFWSCFGPGFTSVESLEFAGNGVKVQASNFISQLAEKKTNFIKHIMKVQTTLHSRGSLYMSMYLIILDNAFLFSLTLLSNGNKLKI